MYAVSTPQNRPSDSPPEHLMMRASQLQYKWVVLGVVAAGTLMITLDEGTVRMVLPELGRVFDVPADHIVWVWLIYLLIGAGLMLTLGWLGDAFGRKRVYTTGLILFTVGLSLCSTADGVGLLIVFRGIQAVGAAMTVAMGNAIVTASFPSRERGLALGIMAFVVSVGLLGGPAIGGALVEWLDWRAVFYTRIPVGIVAAVLAILLLRREVLPESLRQFDRAGAATLFLGVLCILVAINRGPYLGWLSLPVVALLSTGILLLTGFVLIERRARDPVLDMSLFLQRIFATATASHIIFYMATTCVIFALPFVFLDALSLPGSVAGLLLATLYAVRAVASPLAGRISDRIGPWSPSMIGMVTVGAGAALMLSVSVDTSRWDVLLLMTVMGAGMGAFATPNLSTIMGSTSSGQLGTASAVVATSRQIGQSLGLAIAGTAFAYAKLTRSQELLARGVVPDVIEPYATIAGLQATAVLSIALAVVGVLILIVQRAITRGSETGFRHAL